MLDHKTAVVTGGGRGIGAAICAEFARSGARVVVADLDDALAEGTARRIREEGGEAVGYPLDVRCSQSVEALRDFVEERYTRWDVLVNNAAIQTDIPFLEMTEEQWKETLDVNLTGSFLCSRVAAGVMVTHQSGRILNLSSISARRGSRLHTHYCATKAGILGFTRALALELAPYGITVNALVPGIIEAPMTQRVMNLKRSEWLAQIPLGTFGEPVDIAKAALFLASEDARWITGLCMDINGGMFFA